MGVSVDPGVGRTPSTEAHWAFPGAESNTFFNGSAAEGVCGAGRTVLVDRGRFPPGCANAHPFSFSTGFRTAVSLFLDHRKTGGIRFFRCLSFGG